MTEWDTRNLTGWFLGSFCVALDIIYNENATLHLEERYKNMNKKIAL